MATLVDHIRSLESYVERSGARLVRSPLPEWVDGRVLSDLIMLRADLNPQQQFVTLVHELAHWLMHRDPCLQHPCTVFEYEAEAVEALVMARLGLQSPSDQIAAVGDDPTDDLLSASVKRVVCASSRICDALGV
jgi:IrrE N-terminal-like domain